MQFSVNTVQKQENITMIKPNNYVQPGAKSDQTKPGG